MYTMIGLNKVCMYVFLRYGWGPPTIGQVTATQVILERLLRVCHREHHEFDITTYTQTDTAGGSTGCGSSFDI